VGPRDDVFMFDRLYIQDVDKGNKTLCCPSCEEALGTRGDNMFLLRKDRVQTRIDGLEIWVGGFKQQEITDLSRILAEVFPHSNVTARVLQKAELRGFKLQGLRPVPDFVVVVHRNEGRALLTDRNGFYHDLLSSAWQLTQGNVLVVLTRAEPKTDADLFDTQLLRSLATQGEQPTIGAISALGRVFSWHTAPSKAQLEQLQKLIAKAYFREPAAVSAGIPAHWSRKATPKVASSTWCNLL